METEIKTHYNYQEIINWLQTKGIELYGNHFKILETDYQIVYKLIAYFLKDEPTCFQYGINGNKGILLTGPIGCGKTSLMKFYHNLLGRLVGFLCLDLYHIDDMLSRLEENRQLVCT